MFEYYRKTGNRRNGKGGGFAAVLLLLSLLFLSSCSGQLVGFASEHISSRRGAAIQEELKKQVYLGSMLGMSMVEGAPAELQSLGLEDQQDLFPLTAGYSASLSRKIHATHYYTAKSATECIDRVKSISILYSFILLENLLGNPAATVEGCDPLSSDYTACSREKIRSRLFFSAMETGAGAVSSCELTEANDPTVRVIKGE